MTDDRQIDPEEVSAWDEKARDSEFQRNLKAFWTAEEDHEAEAFIREQSDAHGVAKRIAATMDDRPNKVRSLADGVVTYRCHRGCVLAAVVPASNGDLYLSWRGGAGVRRIGPEVLDRLKAGDAPNTADDAAVGKVLDIVDEFTDRYGVAPGYRTDSGREAGALGRGGEPVPAKAARLSELPPDAAITVTCKHADAVLQVSGVLGDMRRGWKTVILPRQR